MLIESTPIQKAQARCVKGCNHDMGKMLEMVEGEPITEIVVAMIMFGANYHEQRHRGHHVEVLIYEKAPEVVEDI